MPSIAGRRRIVSLLLGLLVFGCKQSPPPHAPSASDFAHLHEAPTQSALEEPYLELVSSLGYEGQATLGSAPSLAAGVTLAATFCTGCHLEPVPSHLSRASWLVFYRRLLVALSARGMLDFGLPPRLQSAGAKAFFPPLTPGRRDKWAPPFPGYRLSLNDFLTIAHYYYASAPTALNRPAPQAPGKIAPFARMYAQPLTEGAETMFGPVFVDREKKVVLIGEARSKAVLALDYQGRTVKEYRLPGVVEALTKHDGAIIATLIAPTEDSTDASVGEIVSFREDTPLAKLASRLERPVASTFITADDADQMWVAEYGLFTGGISRFERRGRSRWTFRQRMFDGVGTAGLTVADFNGDSAPDVLAVVGHNEESVLLFTGHNGRYETRQVLKYPPSWGLSSVATGDFNQDGKTDFAVTNGDDKGTHGGPFPYHGIRVFTAQGAMNFKETDFFPLPGAVQVSAADFDRDGDDDLVAIASFPDKHAPTALMYLENRRGSFFARHFGSGMGHRWAYLAIEDFDGDEYPDLVLAGEILVSEIDDPTRKDTNRLGYAFLRNLGKDTR